MKTHTGIEYTVETEVECAAVRGNALASGDGAVDRECEDEILARLEHGEDWAWCSVRVVAKIESGGTTLRCASNWLGCCSYANEEDFKQNGYYDDMVTEVNALIEEAARRLRT